MKSAKTHTSVHQIVTERILAELEKGTLPWQKPWVAGKSAPMNYVSREPYKGVNRLLLPLPGEYITRNQAEKLGGSIAPDAEPHLITFFAVKKCKQKTKDELEDADEATVSVSGTKTRLVFRYYRGFHLDDIEGVPSKLEAESDGGRFMAPDKEADAIVEAYCRREGIRLLSIAGDRAAYNADTDTVSVPLLKQFHNSESYYCVLFHELVHSTGTAARLGRDVRKAAYGAAVFNCEELTAEIGACMLLAHCGLDTRKVLLNSAARIQGWIGALKEDSRLVVTAARKAEKAVAMILGEDD